VAKLNDMEEKHHPKKKVLVSEVEVFTEVEIIPKVELPKVEPQKVETSKVETRKTNFLQRIYNFVFGKK
jgi:hypothetical protein